MIKVVILKESEYNDLKVSVANAMFYLDKLPESFIKSELRRQLRETSKILNKKDGEDND